MLSRRAALMGGSAVAACAAMTTAAGAVATPISTKADDAQLETLYVEWQAADTAETEAFNRADDARLAFRTRWHGPLLRTAREGLERLIREGAA